MRLFASVAFSFASYAIYSTEWSRSSMGSRVRSAFFTTNCRIASPTRLLFIALGYASGVPWLGWLGALLAALTAYIRVFGAALGFAQDFRGPMAKQHRMAFLTAGCLISILEHFVVRTNHSLAITCGLIAAGSLLTCWTRTRGRGAQATGAQLRTRARAVTMIAVR